MSLEELVYSSWLCYIGVSVIVYTLHCFAACQEFYAGLVCLDSGSLTLEEHIVLGQPFATFTESKLRERERELQFMTGDICGSGWQKKPGLSMCHLHTSPVPIEVEGFCSLSRFCCSK